LDKFKKKFFFFISRVNKDNNFRNIPDKVLLSFSFRKWFFFGYEEEENYEAKKKKKKKKTKNR